MNVQSSKAVLWLLYFMIVYNVAEGMVSVFLGSTQDSVSLIGFGLDSFIESLSEMIVIWRLAQPEKLSEGRAVKFIGGTFLILGIYVGYEAIKKIVGQEIAQPTFWGIIIALVSIVIMIFSFVMKRFWSKKLNSKSLLTDTKQTLACIAMSVSLLVGSVFYYFYGIWWFDPLTAIVIAILLLREGIKTMKGDALCRH